MAKKKNQQYDPGIYSVVFHFNIYTAKWNCIPRDRYSEYLNGPSFGVGDTIDDAYNDWMLQKKWNKHCNT